MCNTVISDEINQISYTKAIISCFALFFPDYIREKALTCSSCVFKNEKNKELKTEFINEFDPQTPKNTIISLTNTFHILDKESNLNLQLVELFNLLFSKSIKILERAALISTFRVLRESFCKSFPNDHLVLDTFIINSYNIYCESVTNSDKIDVDFFSSNHLGTLTQPFVLFNEEPDAEDNSVGQNLTNKYYCKKVNYDWKAKSELKTKEQKKIFLSEIYDGLKTLTLDRNTDNLAILTFPKENDTLEYFPTEDGRTFPKQCTKENFIAMFDGVIEEKPTRTMISASGDCLSKFVDAMECEYGNRNPFAEGLRHIIVQNSGREFTMNTLQSNRRNSDYKDKYLKIIRSAYEKAKKITDNN